MRVYLSNSAMATFGQSEIPWHARGETSGLVLVSGDQQEESGWRTDKLRRCDHAEWLQREAWPDVDD